MRSGVQWRRWWGFALLCILAACRWMMSDLIAGAAPSALSVALGLGSACLGLLSWGGFHRDGRTDGPELVRSAVAGAMMLSGPALPLLVRVPGLEVASLTIALALTPVVVAVARPVFRQTHVPELAGRLWPGLAAVAGLLLVLPGSSFTSVREDAVLVAAPLLTGVGAAWLRSARGGGIARAAAACAGAALVLALAAAVQGELSVHSARSLLLAATLDGLLGWLSVLSLLRLGATRWSAQFELVPLLVLLEGLVSIPGSLDVRVAAGLLLLLLASAFLLLPPRPEDPVGVASTQ